MKVFEFDAMIQKDGTVDWVIKEPRKAIAESGEYVEMVGCSGFY